MDKQSKIEDQPPLAANEQLADYEIEWPPHNAISALRLYLATCEVYSSASVYDSGLRGAARRILIGNLRGDINGAMLSGGGYAGCGVLEVNRLAAEIRHDIDPAARPCDRDGNVIGWRIFEETRDHLMDVARGFAPPGRSCTPSGSKLLAALTRWGTALRNLTEEDVFRMAVTVADGPMLGAVAAVVGVYRADLETDSDLRLRVLEDIISHGGKRMPLANILRSVDRAAYNRGKLSAAEPPDRVSEFTKVVEREIGAAQEFFKKEDEKLSSMLWGGGEVKTVPLADLAAEKARIWKAVDDARKATTVIDDDAPIAVVMFGKNWHSGAGWYYGNDESPEDGYIGAFKTREEAIGRAVNDGYGGWRLEESPVDVPSYTLNAEAGSVPINGGAPEEDDDSEEVDDSEYMSEPYDHPEAKAVDAAREDGRKAGIKIAIDVLQDARELLMVIESQANASLVKLLVNRINRLTSAG